MSDKVIDIPEEYGCNPDDYDVAKVAAEIREIILSEYKEQQRYSRQYEGLLDSLADRAEK